MSKTAAAFPGFDSPGVGFEQPFEMLEACHDRVRRSLVLLGKLVDYIERQGHDEQSRSAAADVLRYFDVAAPLHHEDEETHVFPPLLSRDDASIRKAVSRLQDEHQRMNALWLRLRAPLSRWSQAEATDAVSEQTRADVARFRELYAGHLETEEGLVFPAARSCMPGSELACMGQAMQARRQRS